MKENHLFSGEIVILLIGNCFFGVAGARGVGVKQVTRNNGTDPGKWHAALPMPWLARGLIFLWLAPGLIFF